MLGLDDATLVGAPRKMLLGSWERLREPDSVVIDKAGYVLLFPGEPLELGRTFEMNDHTCAIVGISEASAPFVSFPIIYTRYSEAVNFRAASATRCPSCSRGRSRASTPAELGTAHRRAAPACARARPTSSSGTASATTCEHRHPGQLRHHHRDRLVVGTVVAGQTFYLFTVENLKQFGALKAMGVTNRRLVGMILLQALDVGVIGFALGIGMAAAFFEITRISSPTRGIILHVAERGAHRRRASCSSSSSPACSASAACWCSSRPSSSADEPADANGSRRSLPRT